MKSQANGLREMIHGEPEEEHHHYKKTHMRTSPDNEEMLFYEINFQKGPVKEVGVNGCQNEDILEILLHRMSQLQKAFPCRENALAITKMEEALLWLKRRTELREKQGVEGLNKAHRS